MRANRGGAQRLPSPLPPVRLTDSLTRPTASGAPWHKGSGLHRAPLPPQAERGERVMARFA